MPASYLRQNRRRQKANPVSDLTMPYLNCQNGLPAGMMSPGTPLPASPKRLCGGLWCCCERWGPFQQETLARTESCEAPEMADGLEISMDDLRLYVIGYIHGPVRPSRSHGRPNNRDIETLDDRQDLTITLGDYVDPGPDLFGAIDRLAHNPFPTRYVALEGNHEALFEKFLTNSLAAEIWRRNGGLETLYSYGVRTGDLMRGEGLRRSRHALSEWVPKEHLSFLASLRPYLSVNGCFSVTPAFGRVSLEQQSLGDLLWI